MPKAPQIVKILKSKKNYFFQNLEQIKKSAVWLMVDVNRCPGCTFLSRQQAALFITPLSLRTTLAKSFVVCSSPDCLREEFQVFDLQHHTVKQEIKKILLVH